MAEHTFYIRERYVCPQCGMELLWEQRPGTPVGLMLVHETFNCALKGKKFYAPTRQLVEIPDD